MNFGNHNDDNQCHNHHGNNHNLPDSDNCGYDPDYDVDIQIEAESQNPLEFENKFNVKELLRLLHDKVDKVKGKGLSSNDFTDAFKNMLTGLSQNLSNYVLKTTKINGHALTGDIVLTPEDIGVRQPESYRELFITLSGQTQVELLHVPATNKELICINGLIAYPGNEFDYTISEKVVTFTYDFREGEKIMVTYTV